MNDLLQLAVNAHGGLERWNSFRVLRLHAAITGAIWFVKGQGDYLKNVDMTVDTRKERVVTDFPGQNRRFIFEPSRIVMEQTNHTLIMSRDNPEASFEGQQRETPWDPIHVAYFQGEALWTYLNTPFLYTRPGFETTEISPIEVEGEIWRRLKITFPDDIKSHSKQQISCFGPDGLLRRHDYTVDILGGATGLNYASDYQDVQGIVFPTKRRILAYQGDFEPVPEPVLVQLDFSDLTLA